MTRFGTTSDRLLNKNYIRGYKDSLERIKLEIKSLFEEEYDEELDYDVREYRNKILNWIDERKK